MSDLIKINRGQGLYVLSCGSGFTCLGFDVAYRRTKAAAEWLGRPDLMPPPRKGTKRAYSAYRAAYAAVLQRNRETGERAPIELTPELQGLEGRRVEVTRRDGSKRRFWVGKSMGPIPVHLEVARRDSTGGMAAIIMPGDTVRAITEAGRG